MGHKAGWVDINSPLKSLDGGGILRIAESLPALIQPVSEFGRFLRKKRTENEQRREKTHRAPFSASNCILSLRDALA
jgi:hypothetical protein